MTAEEAQLRQEIQERQERLQYAESEEQWRAMVRGINVLILRLKGLLPPVGT